MNPRSRAVLIARWSADLLSDTALATEATCPARARIYGESALFWIKSIRAEIDALEAELQPKGNVVALRPTGPEAA